MPSGYAIFSGITPEQITVHCIRTREIWNYSKESTQGPLRNVTDRDTSPMMKG